MVEPVRTTIPSTRTSIPQLMLVEEPRTLAVCHPVRTTRINVMTPAAEHASGLG